MRVGDGGERHFGCFDSRLQSQRPSIGVQGRSCCTIRCSRTCLKVANLFDVGDFDVERKHGGPVNHSCVLNQSEVGVVWSVLEKGKPMPMSCAQRGSLNLHIMPCDKKKYAR